MSKVLNRRTFLRESSTAALGVALLPLSIRSRPSFDLILRGGVLLDGTGGPAYPSDLGLIGDRIAAIGDIDPEQGRRVLDVSGHFVSPGFIDIHSHSDGDILRYPTADSRVRQGVTTEITGNCGGSAAPIQGSDVEDTRREMEEELGIQGGWSDVASYFQTLEQVGISLNHALLVGQGTLRGNVAGSEDRILTESEMERVLSQVEEAMDHGAFGLSTGLEYVPGRFTPTEEIVAMSRIVARRGGIYASHIRNEEAMLLEAIDEAIRIGRETGARVQISHLKAAGRPNWGKQTASLDLIEGARMEGIEVLADAYPYTAYSTGLTILFSAWAMDGGWDALAKRLTDPETRVRIRDEVNRRVPLEPGAFDLIVISRVRTEANQPLVGMNLLEIAEGWKMEPVDALLRLLEEEDGSVGYIGHGMSPENVEMILSHPLVMVGSDGYSMAPVGEAARSRPHPRSYGTFPRVLGHYCRDRGLFDLPTAVRKMTSMPADQMGISDRGRLAKGMMADLVVFDLENLRDMATFDDPHRYPTGIHHVLVNGTPVVEAGEHTGARPGAVLRRG